MENFERKMENNNYNYQLSIINYPFKVCLLLFLTISLISCTKIKPPENKPFIGENAPLPKQEFRWSNGKMPKSFDPARASAAPETDLVRALYEGLTDVDSKDLKPIPAISTRWSASDDFKIWTFQLRQDAKWSNGESVTAQDFVRSWKRLTKLGGKVSQRQLLKNIVGMDTEDVLPIFAEEETEEPLKKEDPTNFLKQSNSNIAEKKAETELKTDQPNPLESQKSEPKPEKSPKLKIKFGVEAIDNFALQVTLIHSDKDFPSLVAHPIFRPVYGDGKNFEATELSANIVTNGSFVVTSIAKDGVTLDRSLSFWNKNEVKLERVKFVPAENAEQALAAYRAGEIDALSNANFAPLALKLLMTYDDLRQTKHSALSFYEFNLNKKPFDDYRVREALAIAIERELLTEDEMDGATKPALSFLPFENNVQLKQDVEKASQLMSEAGFANGQNFPTLKLLINRNDLQKRIAHAVAKMWKKNLNIETEIIIKEKTDFENSFQNGEFDMVRRGVVLPTSDETASMLAMFDNENILPVPKEVDQISPPTNDHQENQILNEKTPESEVKLPETEASGEKKSEEAVKTEFNNQKEVILTEAQAIENLPAIPLYFPMSFSLVKPYIKGFETNFLDAPSLKKVEIDNNWQPTDKKSISKGKS